MTPLVPLTMFGWIPFVLVLFMTISTRRAVIVAFMVAWMFLPMYGYSISGLPDYTKVSATCAGVLLATALFDMSRLGALRLGWYDLPMAIFVLTPIATSISNGLGVYDGLAESFNTFVQWGMPYLVGRIYFNTPQGMKELIMGLFIGGLVYVPFCLWEIRMSPNLHHMFYGYHQHVFAQMYRWGSWRPMVFMQHGLAVAVWIMSAAMVIFWMWRSGSVKRFWILPTAVWFAIICFTVIASKSVNSWVMLLIGIIVFLLIKYVKSPWPVIVLTALIPVYIGVRAPGIWDGQALVSAIEMVPIISQRADSMQTRLDSENILGAHAMKRPILGWGGWDRNVPRTEEGYRTAITDGMWIILFGKHGIVGLISWLLFLLLPIWLLLWRLPVRHWVTPAGGPLAAGAMVLLLHAIDSLPNAMINPIFMLIAGGLIAMPKLKIKSVKSSKPRHLSKTPRPKRNQTRSQHAPTRHRRPGTRSLPGTPGSSRTTGLGGQA